MYGSPIHHVYIADGFIDDCEELIHKCLQKQDKLDFQTFCCTWLEMKMGCLYQERTSGAEIAELSEEVLHIAKHYMVANTSNYEESVAGLFLVYSLLNLQPYPRFAALRLIPEDVAAISRLEAVARRERRYDVLYILASVLIKGPCQYHAAERERGMEAPIRKYLDGFRSIDSIRGIRPKGVFYRQNEELDIIRELDTLTKRYSEAKADLMGSGPSDRNLQYVDEELPSELSNSLKKIIGGRIDDDNDNTLTEDEEEEPKSKHHALVEAIKAKAMKDIVNPMKHLTGIGDRKYRPPDSQQTQNKSDIKSKPGKIKTNSPTKPQTCKSPKKRKPSPKCNENKKVKPNVKPNSPDKANNVKTENDTTDDEDISLEEFHVEIIPDEKEEEFSENEEENMEEKVIDIQIESLPSLIRTEDNGRVFEIEIIDKYNESNSQVSLSQEESMDKDVPLLNNMPVLSISGNDPDDSPQMDPEPEKSDCKASTNPMEHYEKFKMAHNNKSLNRNLKKTHLRSKFKRLGMLPVANFEESK